MRPGQWLVSSVQLHKNRNPVRAMSWLIMSSLTLPHLQPVRCPIMNCLVPITNHDLFYASSNKCCFVYLWRCYWLLLMITEWKLNKTDSRTHKKTKTSRPNALKVLSCDHQHTWVTFVKSWKHRLFKPLFLIMKNKILHPAVLISTWPEKLLAYMWYLHFVHKLRWREYISFTSWVGGSLFFLEHITTNFGRVIFDSYLYVESMDKGYSVL